jgi:hypothetical protein
MDESLLPAQNGEREAALAGVPEQEGRGEARGEREREGDREKAIFADGCECLKRVVKRRKGFTAQNVLNLAIQEDRVWYEGERTGMQKKERLK